MFLFILFFSLKAAIDLKQPPRFSWSEIHPITDTKLAVNLPTDLPSLEVKFLNKNDSSSKFTHSLPIPRKEDSGNKKIFMDEVTAYIKKEIVEKYNVDPERVIYRNSIYDYSQDPTADPTAILLKFDLVENAFKGDYNSFLRMSHAILSDSLSRESEEVKITINSKYTLEANEYHKKIYACANQDTPCSLLLAARKCLFSFPEKLRKRYNITKFINKLKEIHDHTYKQKAQQEQQEQAIAAYLMSQIKLPNTHRDCLPLEIVGEIAGFLPGKGRKLVEEEVKNINKIRIAALRAKDFKALPFPIEEEVKNINKIRIAALRAKDFKALPFPIENEI